MSASVEVVAKSHVRSLRFTQHLDFQKTLNERVNAYLRENNLPGRDVPAMYVKTAVALAWWLGTYLLLLLGHFPVGVNIALYLVWALAIACIGFNVMHDANHGGYSDHPRVNKLFSLSAELLGMSGFRWRTKHNVWHHTYTNIAGFDDDVETFGFMRLTPREPWKPLYRAQAWYFPLVYSMIAFDFFLRDFMMVFVGRSDANHIYPKMGTGDKITFWAGKLFFIVIMFVLPLQVFPWWEVLIGFLLVMLTLGLVMGVVFQLAHINGDTEFPDPVGDPKHIENEWAVHQVQTTADFAPHNRLLNFYIGGLNYQIEHHLLPHICHLNYPGLAPIVRATCEEFGIRYNCYPTWREAFACHVRELRRLGREAEPVRA
ncbi:MAG TPA: acyl-CoA desaturase [Anaerolineales bacterium]|nr:acyl-CoA desaturase [Anaerolineales bacterium]